MIEVHANRLSGKCRRHHKMSIFCKRNS